MCRYQYNTYVCGHCYKDTEPYTCDQHRECVENNTILLEFNQDIALVRRCITEYNLGNTNTDSYRHNVAELERHFKEYFGRRSGNQGRPLDSFRQIEEHLQGEYDRFPAGKLHRLRPAMRFNDVCPNGCWEGILYNQRKQREEAERRAREDVRLMQERRDREVMEGRRNPGYGFYIGGESPGNEPGNYTTGGGYLGYGSNPQYPPGGSGSRSGHGGRHR